MGLLTLANYNGDENDNDNENENGDENGVDNVDRNYRAADGIVSYLLLTPLSLSPRNSSPLNSSYPYPLFFS